MSEASFHVHIDRGRRLWGVEEEAHGEIGGTFSTLVAALRFVAGESRRFRRASTRIEAVAPESLR
jgi:hypothetical protein